jgi:hypothetical protein
MPNISTHRPLLENLSDSDCLPLHRPESFSGEHIMQARKTTMTFALGFAALVAILPTTTQAADLDVTFTVPVQIQNIRSNWSKVAVYCIGDRDSKSQHGGPYGIKIGEIDVSNRAGSSLNQTITGTIPVPDYATLWRCRIWISHTGASNTFGPIDQPSNRAEVKSLAGTEMKGQF